MAGEFSSCVATPKIDNQTTTLDSKQLALAAQQRLKEYPEKFNILPPEEQRLKELKSTILADERTLNQQPYKPRDHVHWTSTITDRKLQEQQAWKKISTECIRRSYIEDVRKLRSSPINRGGWKQFGYGFKNGSDTFHRFLQRTADLEINKTVSHWRSKHCENDCCKSGKNKWANQNQQRTMADKLVSLDQSLRKIDPCHLRWVFTSGGKDFNGLERALDAAESEMVYVARKRRLEKEWASNLDLVKQKMEEKLEAYGLSLNDYENLESALLEAEKEEEARIEEQERSEREATCAISESDDEVEDEDDEEGGVFFFTSDLPTPPESVTSHSEKDTFVGGPTTLYQLETGSITPQETPMSQECQQPKYTAEEELYMLSKACIEDLNPEHKFWVQKKGDTFHPDYLVHKLDPDRTISTCWWKLCPMDPNTATPQPSSQQTIPEIVVTDPEGANFTLEEFLPILGEEWENEVIERHTWSIMINEAIRRGWDFNTITPPQAVELLYEEGWIPEEDDLALEFDQEITFVDQGQEINIESADNETDTEENEPMCPPTTFEELVEKLFAYNDFFRNWADYQFCPDQLIEFRPPRVLPTCNTCSWIPVALSPSAKNDSPNPSNGVPTIRLHDPEGTIYALEERLPELTQEFDHHLQKRDLYQVKKEIWLGENLEDDDMAAARMRHFAQWEKEFRLSDQKRNRKEEHQQPKEEQQQETWTKLETARAEIANYDAVVRMCLFEVKRDFINECNATFRQVDEELAKKMEKGGRKAAVPGITYEMRLERTCEQLKKKLLAEGMRRVEDGVERQVVHYEVPGDKSLDSHSVEIKGPLGEMWVAREVVMVDGVM